MAFLRATRTIGLACFLLAVVAAPMLAAPPASSKMPAAGTPRTSVRRYLEARRQADDAARAYSSRTISFAELLAARQELTAAHIEYSAAAPAGRGIPELSDYLARQSEVEALENALAVISNLDVDDADVDEQKAEITRYTDAIKAAKKELTRAERTWKVAERKQQFRYLNRRATTVR